MATLESTKSGTLIGAPHGEIASLLDELKLATTNLQDNLAGLGELLQPILRNEPTTENAVATTERAASTDLGHSLVALISRVNTINGVVIDVRNRVEL